MNKEKFFKFFKGLIFGIVFSIVLWFAVGMFAFSIAFNVRKGISYADEVDLDFAVSSCSILPADSVTNNFISADFPTLISLYSTGDFDNRVMITNSDGYYPVSFNFWDDEFSISYYDPFLTGSISKSFTYSNVNDRWFNNVVYTSGVNRFVFFQAYRQSTFNNNVASVNISTTDQYRGNNLGTQFYFYDNNNNYFMIRFLFESTRYDYYRGSLSNRTYIISDSENSAYQQGFNDGYSDAKSSYYQIGYDTGYDVGYDIGERAGIDIGASDNNPYNFTNFFGAIIDVPVKVLTSLFNFNILGVNLLDFFVAIVTIAVVVFVIKLVVGGK